MTIPLKDFHDLPDVVRKELEYRHDFPFLETAVKYLKSLLNDFLNEHQKTHKVDLFISSDGRAKSWNSVCIKLWNELKENQATQIGRKEIEEAYDSIDDLAGGRIEVSYFAEVQNRAGHLIRYFDDMKFATNLTSQEIHDKIYLKDDKEGYRAYHLFVKGPVEDQVGNKKEVVFEIQIRSSFQHVWAKLMHPLVYSKFRDKEQGIPKRVKDDMRNLSEQIFAADSALMTLRDRVEEMD
jgi:ppGpp synthetase/RelA/SpoT-type nucleotidyltranferase